MKILLAWEIGNGQGHIRNLLSVAKRAEAEGHHVEFAVPSMHRLLDTYQVHLTPDVAPFPLPHPNWSAANFADGLVTLGYLDTRGLRNRLDDWHEIFLESDCDVIVTESAPSAILAAMGRIMTVAVGTPFGLPPTDCDVFPDFPKLPGETLFHLADQGLIAECIHKVTNHSAPTLPAYFKPDVTLPFCYDGMDLYGEYRHWSTGWLGPVTPTWQHGLPERLGNFAYLRGDHPRIGQIIGALDNQDIPTRLYVDGGCFAQDTTRLTFLSSFDLDEELGACSRVIHHGSMGMAQAALAAGRPQFTFPYHLENMMNCLRLHTYGTMMGLGYGEHEQYQAALAKPYPTERARLVAESLPAPVDVVGRVLEVCR